MGRMKSCYHITDFRYRGVALIFRRFIDFAPHCAELGAGRWQTVTSVLEAAWCLYRTSSSGNGRGHAVLGVRLRPFFTADK